MRARAHNVQMVEIVAAGLKDLLPEMVFVGGATASLYLPDDLASSDTAVRPTDDVDCVIEVASRSEYIKLEKRIRDLGFSHATEHGAPLCRWHYSGVTVDIMPTDPKIIGFSNRWYKDAIAAAEEFRLPSGKMIRIFTVPYFLASKMEAFKDRGKNDFLGSRDFEDIIALLEGRTTIRKDLFDSPQIVKAYLRDQFQKWSVSEEFLQGISAHLPRGRRAPDDSRRVLDIVKSL